MILVDLIETTSKDTLMYMIREGWELEYVDIDQRGSHRFTLKKERTEKPKYNSRTSLQPMET